MFTEHLFLDMILSILIFISFISYFINVFFSRIMFDILNVDKKLAWIPLYNYYRIFKEYKGRVWKINWGILYIFLAIIPYLLVGSLVFSRDLLIIFFEATSTYLLVQQASSFLTILVICGIIYNGLQIFINIILYWPILYIKVHTVIFFLNLIFGNTAITAILNNNTSFGHILNIASNAISVAFLITYFLAASSLRRNVRNNLMILNNNIEEGRKLAKEAKEAKEEKI